MKLNEALVLRQVGGEYMIVNPFTDTVDMTQVYSLNDTAAWLWQQLEGKDFTVQEVADLLCSEYEVDKETALADAEELCTQWKESGMALEQ